MKPILFNTEMVLAILDGRKCVTRRLIKPRYRDDECGFQVVTNAHTGEFVRVEKISDQGCGIFPDGSERHVSPPYHPGDILYVRETWRVQAAHRFEADARIEFKAGGQMATIQFPGRCSESHERPTYDEFICKWGVDAKWHPSLHMPKEAARIFLRVKYCKAERLRDMVLGDVLMEGVTEGNSYEDTWRRWHDLWNSTINPDDLPNYGWEANPWVWVIRFERCEKPQEV